MTLFDDERTGSGTLSKDEAFAVLQELSGNTPEEIRRQRAHFRMAVKVAVVLQPGNSGKLMTLKVKGVTGDISEGGCSALFPIPARVGDIYRLSFDRSALDLPITFARCVRCRLVREDAFEAGFAFFTPIQLPEPAGAAKASTLVG